MLAHFNFANISEMSCGLIGLSGASLYNNFINLMERTHLRHRVSSFNLVCTKYAKLIDFNLISGRMPSETTSLCLRHQFQLAAKTLSGSFKWSVQHVDAEICNFVECLKFSLEVNIQIHPI